MDHAHGGPALPAAAFDRSAIAVDEYIALANRLSTEILIPKGTARALKNTINVGAWDGERLVGAVRILSDGYLFAALADLLVDPDYRGRGIGRELMNRAFEKTPRGTLLIGADLSSSAFFDHIGCDRGPTGFTMRRVAKPRSGAQPAA